MWRLFPYALLAASALLFLAMARVILVGTEERSTTVALTDVTPTEPAARWLTLTGGGLFLPGAFYDETRKRSASEGTKTAWFVPLLTEADAIAVVAAGDDEQPVIGHRVIVQFSPSEFQKVFPNPDSPSPDEVFVLGDVEGLRASVAGATSRLTDFLRQEYGTEPGNVILIKYGDRPLQRGEALLGAGASIAVFSLALLWVVKRWRRPS